MPRVSGWFKVGLPPWWRAPFFWTVTWRGLCFAEKRSGSPTCNVKFSLYLYHWYNTLTIKLDHRLIFEIVIGKQGPLGWPSGVDARQHKTGLSGRECVWQVQCSAISAATCFFFSCNSSALVLGASTIAGDFAVVWIWGQCILLREVGGIYDLTLPFPFEPLIPSASLSNSCTIIGFALSFRSFPDPVNISRSYLSCIST